MSTLEQSYVQNTMNKSYEKLLAETIEAQANNGILYHHPSNNYHQYQMAMK